MRAIRLTQSFADEPSAEWKLLVICARTRLLDSHRNEIKELLKRPVNWDRFCSATERNKLECLVYRNLIDSFKEVPREAVSSLETAARRRVQLGLMYTGRLIELLDCFESAGIRAVPYKGPVLGSLAYGNLSLRSFQDLDFILPQSQIMDAARMLLKDGFRAYPDPTAEEQARFLDRFHPGQYAFTRDSKPPQIELHTERTLRYLPIPLDWKRVSQRFIEAPLGGRKVRTFSLEDTLILLSVHGTKHFWERLSWICDVAELIQSPNGINWELGHELAKEADCRRVWLLALNLANRLLQAPLPDIVQTWIKSDPQVDKMSVTIAKRLMSENSLPGAPERLLFRLRSYEKWTTGLSQSLRTATYPTEDDWNAFKLPGWAAPLYFAVRPWRLLREHGLGLRKNAAA